MSVQAISWVFDFSAARLGAKLVLLSIANHARADGSGAWPSVPTIARESGLCIRRVEDVFPLLEDLGELSIQRGAGPGGCHLYSLPKMLLPPPAKIAGAPPAKSGNHPPQSCALPPARIAGEPSFSTTVLKNNHPPWPLANAKTFWKRVLRTGQKQVSKVQWQLLAERLAPVRLVGWRNDRLVLRVPNEEFAVWLGERESLLLKWIRLAGIEDIRGISYVPEGSKP